MKEGFGKGVKYVIFGIVILFAWCKLADWLLFDDCFCKISEIQSYIHNYLLSTFNVNDGYNSLVIIFIGIFIIISFLHGVVSKSVERIFKEREELTNKIIECDDKIIKKQNEMLKK